MARPRQYDHDELRTAIVEAARRLLEEGGPPALTARALARSVGTTPGTIYNLFSNMNTVLLEVKRRIFIELVAKIDAIPPAPPRDWLIALADAYLDFILERGVVWRVLFEGPRVTDTYPEWYTTLIDDVIDRLAAPLSQLGPAAPARRLAERLFVSVHGVVALVVSGRLDLIARQEPHGLAHDIVDQMVESIEAGVL